MIELIDMALCLVLDKRVDMWNELERQFREHNIDIKMFLAGDGHLDNYEYDHIDDVEPPPLYAQTVPYPTWWRRPNAYDAWKCHKKMIRKAKDADARNLLMVEDDTVLEDDFDDIIDKVSPFFSGLPWDMIYFGSFHLNSAIEILPHVFKVNGSGGFHCVLIDADLFDVILDFPPFGPIDYMCGKYIQPNYNCYAIYPCIASQRDGFSYVEGSDLVKPSRYDKGIRDAS